MIRTLVAFLRSLYGNAVKLKDWFRDPRNGDDYVTPFKKQYVSTGTHLVLIFVYRTVTGLYTFISGYLLDGLAHIFNVIIGIASDLWHSNPNYTRWAIRSAWSLLLTVGTYIVIIGKTISSVAMAAAISLIGLFR